MKDLLIISALFLGLAISAHTIYLVVSKTLERHRQRTFILKRLDLLLANIMKLSEELLGCAKKISKHNNSNELITIENDYVQEFITLVEDIKNIEFSSYEEKAPIYLNNKEIIDLCEFIDKFNDLKNCSSYRAKLLTKNQGKHNSCGHLDLHIKTRFEDLNAKYKKVKLFSTRETFITNLYKSINRKNT